MLKGCIYQLTEVWIFTVAVVRKTNQDYVLVSLYLLSTDYFFPIQVSFVQASPACDNSVPHLTTRDNHLVLLFYWWDPIYSFLYSESRVLFGWEVFFSLNYEQETCKWSITLARSYIKKFYQITFLSLHTHTNWV